MALARIFHFHRVDLTTVIDALAAWFYRAEEKEKSRLILRLSFSRCIFPPKEYYDHLLVFFPLFSLYFSCPSHYV